MLSMLIKKINYQFLIEKATIKFAIFSVLGIKSTKFL
jgi:hypothetical protein